MIDVDHTHQSQQMHLGSCFVLDSLQRRSTLKPGFSGFTLDVHWMSIIWLVNVSVIVIIIIIIIIIIILIILILILIIIIIIITTILLIISNSNK